MTILVNARRYFSNAPKNESLPNAKELGKPPKYSLGIWSVRILMKVELAVECIIAPMYNCETSLTFEDSLLRTHWSPRLQWLIIQTTVADARLINSTLLILTNTNTAVGSNLNAKRLQSLLILVYVLIRIIIHMVGIIHDAKSDIYFTMCCPSLIPQKSKNTGIISLS